LIVFKTLICLGLEEEEEEEEEENYIRD